jgi:Methyltransferase small domain
MDKLTSEWLESLEARHLADLTVSEVARALRALSSCYVERRGKLAQGGALGTAGKRAAFALFYGPMHYLIVREIVRSFPGAREELAEIIDLGCGTGAAGAAWAVESGARRIRGFDRHPWAVREAGHTYRHFRLDGRAVVRDIARPDRGPRERLDARRGMGIIAAYTANEMSAEGRAHLLEELQSAREEGARILVVEPIARRGLGWWDEWRDALIEKGGRADEWRFPSSLPTTQRTLARAAGLDPREMTGRSIYVMT